MTTLWLLTRRLFTYAPFSTRRLCSSPFNGSLLVPFFCLVAPNVSLCPSFAQPRLAPLCSTTEPPTLDPPLMRPLLPLSCPCCIHIQPSFRHLCFTLGMVNVALKEALLSEMTPHLFYMTECSPSFVFFLFIYPRWFPSHFLPLQHLFLSLPPAFSFLRIRSHGTFEQSEPLLLWVVR
jgi:hypothetical protein